VFWPQHQAAPQTTTLRIKSFYTSGFVKKQLKLNASVPKVASCRAKPRRKPQPCESNPFMHHGRKERPREEGKTDVCKGK
jgi:hypothetical protein